MINSVAFVVNLCICQALLRKTETLKYLKQRDFITECVGDVKTCRIITATNKPSQEATATAGLENVVQAEPKDHVHRCRSGSAACPAGAGAMEETLLLAERLPEEETMAFRINALETNTDPELTLVQVC